MLLHDLYALQNYYNEAQSIMYEDDLVERYGASDVRDAIQNGYIDHGWIPCGNGRRRCVCRLSSKGAALVEGRVEDGSIMRAVRLNESEAVYKL